MRSLYIRKRSRGSNLYLREKNLKVLTVVVVLTRLFVKNQTNQTGSISGGRSGGKKETIYLILVQWEDIF